MGTRSVTVIMDGNHELVRIYRQMDGYPEGHGVDLAKLCDRMIVNGYQLDMTAEAHANGMGCLAAQIIAGLKTGGDGKRKLGHIYIEPSGPEHEIGDWVEYIYIVRGNAGSKPTIECMTKTGPWPFNVQTSDDHVFMGTADKWLAKYGQKDDAPRAMTATVIPADAIKQKKPRRRA